MTIDTPAADAPAATSGTDFGLDADEQAAFDAMRAEPAPTGDPGHTPEPPAEPVAATPDPAPAGDNGTKALGEPPVVVAGEDGDDEDAEPAALPDGTKPPKRVSFNKFKRAEDEAKAMRAQLEAANAEKAKLAENQARLDERLRLINEALTTQSSPPIEEEVQIPDVDTDIFGHVRGRFETHEQKIARLSEEIEEIKSGRQAETADQKLAEDFRSDAQRFAAKEPNFWDGYAHLRQIRFLQLAYDGGKDLTDPNTPPLTQEEFAKINRSFVNEERALVAKAIKEKKSPAEVAYGWARMTGFRPRTADEIAAARAPASGAAPTNGATPSAPAAASPAAPAATANGAAKPSVTAVIDGIKKGQEASLSLSHGGGAPAPVLNMEKLATMPDDEFGALLESMTPAALRRAMGGGP